MLLNIRLRLRIGWDDKLGYVHFFEKVVWFLSPLSHMIRYRNHMKSIIRCNKIINTFYIYFLLDFDHPRFINFSSGIFDFRTVAMSDLVSVPQGYPLAAPPPFMIDYRKINNFLSSGGEL